jgi:hypothetical protein
MRARTTIGTTGTLAVSGIPPAAAELAVIEEDRNFRWRMKKARAPDVANRPASAPSEKPTDARPGSLRVAVI